MDNKEYLRKVLNIREEEISDMKENQNSLVIEIKDSNTFGNIYNRIDKIKDLEIQDDPEIDEVNLDIIWVDKEQQKLINLMANLDKDNYALNISQI